jgi:hypothetical protein
MVGADAYSSRFRCYKADEAGPPVPQRVERPTCDPKLIQIIKAPAVAEPR